jgi:hypothetical protein
MGWTITREQIQPATAAWALVAEGFMVKLHTNCLLPVVFPFPTFLASAAAAHAAGRAARFLFDKVGVSE